MFLMHLRRIKRILAARGKQKTNKEIKSTVFQNRDRFIICFAELAFYEFSRSRNLKAGLQTKSDKVEKINFYKSLLMCFDR